MEHDHNSAQTQLHTAAADVNFTKLNNDQYAESSSRAESRSSMGKSSSLSDRYNRAREERVSSRTSSPAGNAQGHTSTPHQRKSGGFLLDSVFTHTLSRPPPQPRRYLDKKIHTNGESAGARKDHGEHRISGESSSRSSPLARRVSRTDVNKNDFDSNDNQQSPAVDPAQLVQMALNLSESRKRHVSSSLPVPVVPTGARRAAVDSGYGTVRGNASATKRPEYLDGGSRIPFPTNRKPSQYDGSAIGDTTLDGNVFYTFSPATLSRAEKARRYFELASEHRRLLEYLPPLRTSDTAANGTYAMPPTSTYARSEVSRPFSGKNAQRSLGRKYNPLQALRNRRVRNRERRPLTAPPETWQETDRIRRWIDGVEAASQDMEYRLYSEQARIPTFSGELELESESANRDTSKHHRRTDTAGSVVTRMANGWTIEPAELLADTYWIEKDDNKTIIEDRQGNRFLPQRQRLSVDIPRHSKESARDFPRGTEGSSLREDSPDGDQVRPRHRSKLPIPHRLRRNHVSRSASATSNSSDEGRRPSQLRPDQFAVGDENVGPLERHMREMIAKEEREELASPELASREQWGSVKTSMPPLRTSMDVSYRESSQPTHDRPSTDISKHRRARSAEGRMGSIDAGVSSTHERSPDSPNYQGFQAFDGMDMSSPSDYRSSMEQKVRRRLPVFRTQSKENNQIEHTDFAAPVGTPLSPVLSADNTEPARSSMEFRHPPRFGRQKTAESATSSAQRSDANDSTAKEPNSKRFFKSGRLGDLVRGESVRLGDRFRNGRERVGDNITASDGSRGATDDSDFEAAATNHRRILRSDQSDAESDVSPRASMERERPRSKYYTSNLPSFVSSSERENRNSVSQTPLSEVSDPFVRRGPNQSNISRSSRLTPTMNLPDDYQLPIAGKDRQVSLIGHDESHRASLNSRDDLALTISNTTMSQRKRSDGLPMTGLAREEARRHWSISDQAPSVQAAKVTIRDVARARALLLSSGIKAREISFMADSTRDNPEPLLITAAKTVGQKLEKTSRKQEYIVAGRMLSSALDTSSSDFEGSLLHFQNDLVKPLAAQMEELSHRASEQLAKTVHETSDEADAFNVELTTKQPQEVKRVDDAIDAMFRKRQRKLRWLRRTGFKLLEWLVLGIMWWVWFVVVIFNTGRRLVVGLLHFLRWLLWF